MQIEGVENRNCVLKFGGRQADVRPNRCLVALKPGCGLSAAAKNDAVRIGFRTAFG